MLEYFQHIIPPNPSPEYGGQGSQKHYTDGEVVSLAMVERATSFLKLAPRSLKGWKQMFVGGNF